MAKLAYSKLKLKTEIPTAQIEIPVGDDIQIVEVKTYLPIEEKITLLERVINLAQDDMHFYNTIKLDVLLGTEILYAYTNLSFTDAVKDNPLNWNKESYILYGEKDNLTSLETIDSFAKETASHLTIMKDGEHWFHTDEQLKFLDEWIKNTL